MDVQLKYITVVFMLLSLGLAQDDEGFFWHITDMHWDPTYEEGEGALSCNSGVDGDGDWGYWGDFDCDAPWSLVNSSVWAMKNIHPDPDFLIWTGDDTPHIWDDDILHKDAVKTIIFNMTDKLLEVWPDKTIYSALGNHDWHPKNKLPPHNDPFYEEIADKWQPWLQTQDANQTFRKGGYYTMMTDNNLQILILNTNLYYKSNDMTEGMPDPANQWQWMDDRLKEAEDADRKVMIVAHVPPGMFEKHQNYSWFYPYYNKMWIHLHSRYQDTIGAVHMAHHHTDTYRIVKDDKGEVVGSILLGPAVAPWETTLPGVMGGAGNNPSIRLVKYNRNTGQVANVIQYYLNLKEANKNNQDKWQLAYNGTEYYQLQDMGTQSLADLTDKLWEDDVFFTRYYMANGVFYDRDERWTPEMRRVHYCAISEVDYDGYNACMRPIDTDAANTCVLSDTLMALTIVFLSLLTG